MNSVHDIGNKFSIQNLLLFPEENKTKHTIRNQIKIGEDLLRKHERVRNRDHLHLPTKPTPFCIPHEQIQLISILLTKCPCPVFRTCSFFDFARSGRYRPPRMSKKRIEPLPVPMVTMSSLKLSERTPRMKRWRGDVS